MDSPFKLLAVSALLVLNPHAWPDYGGTPDVRKPDGIGLSPSELARTLARLGAGSPVEREDAAKEILRGAGGSETVIGKALWEGCNARNNEMKRAIRQAAQSGSEATTGDLLMEGLISISPLDPDLGKGAFCALRILTLLRALDRLDTLAAYKRMIEFAPRHAGVFRHAIGRMIAAHGLNALPALVYSRSSPDDTIRMYAVSWIRDMGDPRLSEQVKLKSPRRLAQLLEAYGSVRDLDAIDVIVSLINDDSVFVRAAARRAIAAYGVNAKWPVYRSYENSLGREPPEGATPEALLAELYAHFDASRIAPELQRFLSGLRALGEGRFEEMAAAYRDVLREDPLFPRRGEMAAGFLALADRAGEQGDDRKAAAAVRMALRVAEPESKEAGRARARLEWRQAEALREKGIVDLALYRKVIEHDPGHEMAKDRIRYLTGAATPPERIVAKSLGVSFFVFLAFLAFYFRLKKSFRVKMFPKNDMGGTP